MKKGKGPVRPAPAGKTKLSRWTIERLDRDTGISRVECVPMHDRHLTGTLLEGLAGKGLEVRLDDLSLWDFGRLRTKVWRVRTLAKKLHVKKEERTTLSENMVFWVLEPADPDRGTAVYPATHAARHLARQLYESVTRAAPGGGSHAS